MKMGQGVPVQKEDIKSYMKNERNILEMTDENVPEAKI